MGINKIKLNDKKGLQFKSSFTAAVLVSMVITGVFIMGTEWSNDYGTTIDSELRQQFDPLNNVSIFAEEAQGTISSDDAFPGQVTFEGNTFKAVFGIIIGIFTPFTLFNNVLLNLADLFGVPDYIAETIWTLTLFAIIFALVAIIFRVQKGSV